MVSTTASGFGDYYLESNKSVPSGPITQVPQLQYYIPRDEPVRELGKYEPPAMGMVPPYEQTRVRTFQAVISGSDLAAAAARQSRYISTNPSHSIVQPRGQTIDSIEERRRRSCRICGSDIGSPKSKQHHKRQTGTSPKHDNNHDHRRYRSHHHQRTPMNRDLHHQHHHGETRSCGSTTVISRRGRTLNGGAHATSNNYRFRSCSSSSSSVGARRFYSVAGRKDDKEDLVLVLGKEINRYQLTETERKALIRDLRNVKVDKQRRYISTTNNRVRSVPSRPIVTTAAPSLPPIIQDIQPYRPPVSQPHTLSVVSVYDESRQAANTPVSNAPPSNALASNAPVSNTGDYFSPYLPTKIAPAEYVMVSPMSRTISHANTHTKMIAPPSVVSRSSVPSINPLLSNSNMIREGQQPQRVPLNRIISRSTSVADGTIRQLPESHIIRHQVPVELSSTHPATGFGSNLSNHKYYHYCPDLPANKLNSFPHASH